MGSRVFVVALALGLPLVGCTQGDSQVVNTDPNNNGRDSGNGGNNGRTDGSRADGGGVIDNDGWSDFDGGAWTRKFTAAPDNAEHAGYLASTQSPDGTIHLISSRLHYRFNLEWLKQPAP